MNTPAASLDFSSNIGERSLAADDADYADASHQQAVFGFRYLLDDLLADANSGHKIVATIYVQAGSMYRLDGPAEMQPVGEVEFANGIAAMGASGTYGKTKICAGIVGQADLNLGSRVEPVLAAPS